MKGSGIRMKTYFNFSKCDWSANAAGRVSRHDLVFKAPPFDPIRYGMPLGNGDIGVLTWCEPDKLYMIINKCDLWDDVDIDDFSNWESTEEEHSTTLRHGCRLIIDFGEPVFDEFYISEFEARLSLADGLLTVTSVSPFGKIEIKAFVTLDRNIDGYGVLCCKVKASLTEKHKIKLYSERYGSRTFSHWYKSVVKDPSIGLSGTETFADGDKMFITHKLPCGTFACGIKTDDCDFAAECFNSHRVGGLLSEGKECVFYAGISSPTKNGATEEISAVLEKASNAGFDALYNANTLRWNEFWEKSYIETQNDFADNIWALTMFYDRCSQGGKYPGRFIDGLWATARDFQAWNFYFHWNQQETYWSLNAAGHHELCESYLNYRFDSLPKAVRTAEKYHGITNGGAFVSDVCDRRGNNSLSELENHTPVAEIALDFYRQYIFTCDKIFLVNKALPYMTAAARYMQTLFKKEDDGKYHAVNGTGYEGWIRLRDATTELACGRALFRAVLKALRNAGQSVPEEALWKDILENTAPYILDKPYEKCVETTESESRIKEGPFAGEPYDNSPVFTSGYSFKDGKNMYSREKEGIFPVADKAAVFPCGDVGIKDKGSELYHAAVNTEKLYGRVCMGWDPSAITAARLGLDDETSTLIDSHIKDWLYFCNGFGHYGTGEDYNNRFATNAVDNFVGNTQISTNKPDGSWSFRHMGTECTSVISCALSESLLQSYDGTVRVFPAVKSGASAKFTLHATGGFVVSSEMKKGKILWVAVRSLFGNTLAIANPWDTSFYINGSVKNTKPAEGSVAEIPTEKGEIIVLTSEPNVNFETESMPVIRNNDVKKHPSGRTLGREGIF